MSKKDEKEQKVYMVGPVPNKYLKIVNEAQWTSNSTITTFKTADFQTTLSKSDEYDYNNYSVEEEFSVHPSQFNNFPSDSLMIKVQSK